eukprot:Lankesteria_metandrocarpae@DN5415_c1_g1_i4.p1
MRVDTELSFQQQNMSSISLSTSTSNADRDARSRRYLYTYWNSFALRFRRGLVAWLREYEEGEHIPRMLLPFKNKWGRLVIFHWVSAVSTVFFLGWQPLSELLFKSGAYLSECGEDWGGPGPCDKQYTRVQALYTVALTATALNSAVSGLLYDNLGPLFTAVTGFICTMLGFSMLAMSSDALRLYIPAFICAGGAVNLIGFPTLVCRDLFPKLPGLVISSLMASQMLSTAVPIFLTFVWNQLPLLTFQQLIWLYLILVVLPSCTLYVLSVPLKRPHNTAAMTDHHADDGSAPVTDLTPHHITGSGIGKGLKKVTSIASASTDSLAGLHESTTPLRSDASTMQESSSPCSTPSPVSDAKRHFIISTQHQRPPSPTVFNQHGQEQAATQYHTEREVRSHTAVGTRSVQRTAAATGQESPLQHRVAGVNGTAGQTAGGAYQHNDSLRNSSQKWNHNNSMDIGEMRSVLSPTATGDGTHTLSTLPSRTQYQRCDGSWIGVPTRLHSVVDGGSASNVFTNEQMYRNADGNSSSNVYDNTQSYMGDYRHTALSCGDNSGSTTAAADRGGIDVYGDAEGMSETVMNASSKSHIHSSDVGAVDPSLIFKGVYGGGSNRFNPHTNIDASESNINRSFMRLPAHSAKGSNTGIKLTPHTAGTHNKLPEDEDVVGVGKSGTIDWKLMRRELVTPEFITFALFYVANQVQLGYFPTTVRSRFGDKMADFLGYIGPSQALWGFLIGLFVDWAGTELICGVIVLITFGMYLCALINVVELQYFTCILYIIASSYIFTTRYTFVDSTFATRNFGTLVGLIGASSGLAYCINMPFQKPELFTIMYIVYLGVCGITAGLVLFLWTRRHRKSIYKSWANEREMVHIPSILKAVPTVSVLQIEKAMYSMLSMPRTSDDKKTMD